MEQLSFDLIFEKNKFKARLCDWREVKIHGKNLLLGDWEIVGKYSNSPIIPHNWGRRLYPKDNFSCIGLMVSWTQYPNNRFYWRPFFHGPDLHTLQGIYDSFYPQIKPSYADDQLEEAKQHLNFFINRVNSLKIFF